MDGILPLDSPEPEDSVSFEAELQSRIKQKLEPWYNWPEEPPFSVEKLVAMALLLHGRPLTPTFILRWMNNSFLYYNNIVYSAFEQGLGLSFSLLESQRRKRFSNDFKAAFNAFKLPLAKVKQGNEETRYTISPAAGRLYLYVTLGYEGPGTFPFLKLPAELRAAIYDMVVALPQSGVSFKDVPSQMGARAITRDMTRPLSLEQWQIKAGSIKVRRLSKILQHLMLNRQIWKEAAPRLFNINTFVVRSVSQLSALLLRIPENYRPCISHIAFSYPAYDQFGATEAFKMLASMTGLQKLDIHMDEKQWIMVNDSDPNSPNPNVRGLPWLRKMRGLQVTFHGECPTIAADLKPLMEIPRKKPRRASKKRKEAEYAEGERKQPFRAAKKTKTHAE